MQEENWQIGKFPHTHKKKIQFIMIVSMPEYQTGQNAHCTTELLII